MRSAAVCAVLAALCYFDLQATSDPDPVLRENQRPGSPDWEVTNPAANGEIEGYASATSINRGEVIDLYVSTIEPRYAIDVYRMGWYGGAGARRVAGPIDRAGIRQEIPAPDQATGLVECRWRDPYRLRASGTDGPWPSGVYIARLTTVPDPTGAATRRRADLSARPIEVPAREGRRVGPVRRVGLVGWALPPDQPTPPTRPARPTAPAQAFMVFVVRDDASRSTLVFQSSVTTFAAYNNWGGKSLYAFNSGNAPARKVSFNRPYATNPYGVRLDGAGDFLRRWEYNAVRWLEREDYDVTYLTNVDVHRHDDRLLRHRVFLSVGHDEYWSWAMREHIEAARDGGVSLAFLGAGIGYWQIRLEPDANGNADRTIVAYKEAAGDTDPIATDADPSNNRFVTGRWRDAPTGRPEERLIGVMYAADPVDGDIVVDEATHWAFAGTGLKRGDALGGLLGYEVDATYGNGPPGLQRLGHSPFADRSGTRYADMTIYTAPGGALVFATGSMQWNWGLDGYNAPEWHTNRVNDAAQRITRNVLARMIAAKAAPSSDSRLWMPSAIVLVAMIIASAAVLRAWHRARMARH